MRSKFQNEKLSPNFLIEKLDHLTIKPFKIGRNASETAHKIFKCAQFIQFVPSQILQSLPECTLDFIKHTDWKWNGGVVLQQDPM